MSNSDAIDAFNRALHSEGRMKKPSPRELNDIKKAQRKRFIKHARSGSPKPTGAEPQAAAPTFEPFVLTRANKKDKWPFHYVRSVDAKLTIRANFKDLKQANAFARTVNRLYDKPAANGRG